MSARSITVEERAALQEIEGTGPSRTLNARVRGRLALYRMIEERPQGWMLTALGRQMLHSGRVEPLSPEAMLWSLTPVLATAQNMAWADLD